MSLDRSQPGSETAPGAGPGRRQPQPRTCSRLSVRSSAQRAPERVRDPSNEGALMSYSWGASRTSADPGGRPIERSHPTVDPASVPAGVGSTLKSPPIAAALAPMVELWQRLLAEHAPDDSGYCRTCTKGGTGLPTTPWPCVINGIADMARRIYHAEQHRTAS